MTRNAKLSDDQVLKIENEISKRIEELKLAGKSGGLFFHSPGEKVTRMSRSVSDSKPKKKGILDRFKMMSFTRESTASGAIEEEIDQTKQIADLAARGKEIAMIAGPKLVFGRSLRKQRMLKVPDPTKPSETIDVPAFVVECAKLIRKHFKTPGIFRIPGSASEITLVKKTLVLGNEASISEGDLNIFSVCDLLKSFWKELPEPLFPFDSYPRMLQAYRDNKTEELFQEAEIKDPVNRGVQKYLFDFLAEVSTYSAWNLMEASNLGILFAINCIRPVQETLDTIIQDTKDVIQLFLILLNREIDAYLKRRPDAVSRILDKPAEVPVLPDAAPLRLFSTPELEIAVEHKTIKSDSGTSRTVTGSEDTMETEHKTLASRDCVASDIEFDDEHTPEDEPEAQLLDWKVWKEVLDESDQKRLETLHRSLSQTSTETP
jgi:hypothetical protein